MNINDIEQFYAVVKLVTGEDIIAKIIANTDEDGFIVENPFEIVYEMVETPAGQAWKVDFCPWMKFSMETIFYIEKEKIVTIGEADPRIISMYNITKKKSQKKSTDPSDMDSENKININKEMGYIDNIKEAREKLEEIFKLNQ